MSDIRFRPFDLQEKILDDESRIVAAFAGKRSGKTEIGAIKSIMWQEQKKNFDRKGVDPFIGAIIAPTTDMLRRLSLKKFLAYAKPFIKRYNKAMHEIEWHDGSIIYGLSADKPHRLEGMKLHWGWL